MTEATSPAAQFLASDMFDGQADAPASPNAPQATFTGQLVRNADVRTKPPRDGLHAVPIVCLELKSTAKHDHRICHAQIAFKDNERHQAEQRAAQLKKGHIVTVSTCALEVCMTFPQAQIINTH